MMGCCEDAFTIATKSCSKSAFVRSPGADISNDTAWTPNRVPRTINSASPLTLDILHCLVSNICGSVAKEARRGGNEHGAARCPPLKRPRIDSHDHSSTLHLGQDKQESGTGG